MGGRGWAALAAVAADQGGAFSRVQAHRTGISNYRLAAGVARGELIAEAVDIFRFASAPLDLAARDWLAWLGAGPGAVMAGWSAARLHGMDASIPAVPCVSVPPGRHIHRPGVVVLRDDLPDTDVEFRSAALVTTVRRTVFDGLRLLDDEAAERWLDRALQQRWTTLNDLRWRVRWWAGRRGAPRLVRLVREAARGARSQAERLLITILRTCGISGWEYNVPIRLAGGEVVLDAALVRLRLAIEIDGRAWHSDPVRFQRDRTRQNLLVAAGWTVLRFTWADLRYRPEMVTHRVQETARRLHRALA